LLLFLGLWLARSDAAREADIREAVPRENAAQLAAFQRRVEVEQGKRRAAIAEQSGSPSAAYRSSAGTVYFSAPRARASTARERAAEDYRIRQQAEARLRAEQARFAQLTGQDQTYWQSGISGSNPGNNARCAQAKADRDNAYQLVVNNRTFEFIRHWNNIVYEACKNT
jgi:hypothetical protein